MSFGDIISSISAFFKTEKGKHVLKWAQRLINTAIFAWLVFQLSTIGWVKVWNSFPTQPLFYVLFLLIFFQLPLFELLIYRLIWTFDALKAIPIFVLKRVYNKDVMGYSGELYFFVWAKKTLQKRGREIFKIIKDNNIISSVASTFISIALIAVFLFTDQIKIVEWIANQNQVYIWGGIILLIIIIILFIKFRHYVISMPLKQAYKIFGIQLFRLLLGQAMNLLMYVIVLPEIPLHKWFTYIAVDIIVSRIPFLPNRDLVFAGIGISMASGMQVPKDAVAGIVIAKSVLNKVGGAVSFGLSNLFKQSDIVPDPEDNIDRFNELGEMENTSKQI